MNAEQILREHKRSQIAAKAQSRKERAKMKGTKPKKREAVKVFPDGREVCNLRTVDGREEYLIRTSQMATRQGNRCQCGRHIVAMVVEPLVSAVRATFGHDIPRGMGGARRDDRIELPDGTWINQAECPDCNMAKGSRRTHETYKPVPRKERSIMADKISEARLQQLIEMGNEISPPPAVLDIVKALRELSELRLLLEEVERLTARIETLEKALRKIVNPIEDMRAEAEAEGNKLCGPMAWELASDPAYLKQIARAVLGKE